LAFALNPGELVRQLQHTSHRARVSLTRATATPPHQKTPYGRNLHVCRLQFGGEVIHAASPGLGLGLHTRGFCTLGVNLALRGCYGVREALLRVTSGNGGLLRLSKLSSQTSHLGLHHTHTHTHTHTASAPSS